MFPFYRICTVHVDLSCCACYVAFTVKVLDSNSSLIIFVLVSLTSALQVSVPPVSSSLLFMTLFVLTLCPVRLCCIMLRLQVQLAEFKCQRFRRTCKRLGISFASRIRLPLHTYTITVNCKHKNQLDNVNMSQ